LEESERLGLINSLYDASLLRGKSLPVLVISSTKGLLKSWKFRTKMGKFVR